MSIRHHVRSLLSVATAVALGTTLLFAPAAGADPASDPTTSSDAKQAWLDATEAAEAANEQLLLAQEAEEAAHKQVSHAKVKLLAATLDADSARTKAVQAAAEYASYRGELAEFANASYRGAGLGQLSALLTAESTSDYLDEVTSLDQVAGSTRQLLESAFAAREASENAAVAAEDAEKSAADARKDADDALTAAENATAKVTEKKEALEADVEHYQSLFESLSEQERQTAMAAQQAAWERQAREAAERAAAEIGDKDKDVKVAAASSAPAPSSKAQAAVDAALSKLGSPYSWGSSGPSSFDCSGLTSWAWRQAGVTIPRTSSSQSGLPSVPLDQLQPGDLVTYYSPVHHVAMYIGDGKIIHASTSGKPVFITSLYKGGPYPTGHRVSY